MDSFDLQDYPRFQVRVGRTQGWWRPWRGYVDGLTNTSRTAWTESQLRSKLERIVRRYERNTPRMEP